MRKRVRATVLSALGPLLKEKNLREDKIPAIVVETPSDEKFGDFSSNAAMVLAKPLKSAPRKIAESMLDALRKEPIFDSVEIAGPGFINFFVKPAVWVEDFRKIPDDGSDYGSGSISGSGDSREKILLEFVSANPTGPLHIGHGRGAAFGDVLARLLKKAGFNITCEYYVNDAGLQMENLGRSVASRYMEILGGNAEFPENGYRGDYIKDIAREIAEKEGGKYADAPSEEKLTYFTSYAAEKILGGIKEDLKRFRVSFDNWVSEKTFHSSGKVEHLLKRLEQEGTAYEKDSALWLKTSSAGDEKDRVLRRSNGATTYFAADIAYHDDKYARGFTKQIDIWGADHHGYVPRMKAGVTALGKAPESLEALLIQLVHLKKGGQVVAMSTRSGTFTTLIEVLDEVGVDAARFFFLMRSHESQLEFDLDLAKKQSSENPVYYVQYAHARISNILKTAREKGIKEVPQNPDWKKIQLDDEIKLMKKALAFPGLVEDCAGALSPHPITHYLVELAGMFHRYYNIHRVVDLPLPTDRAKSGDKVLSPTDEGDEPLTLARIALVARLRTVLQNGLRLLGITAPDRM